MPPTTGGTPASAAAALSRADTIAGSNSAACDPSCSAAYCSTGHDAPDVQHHPEAVTRRSALVRISVRLSAGISPSIFLPFSRSYATFTSTLSLLACSKPKLDGPPIRHPMCVSCLGPGFRMTTPNRVSTLLSSSDCTHE
jgi:hypothetical protein